MNILFLGNTDNPLINWLRRQGEIVQVKSDKINFKQDENWLKDFDFAVSYGYRHMIRKNVIDIFGPNIINMHISLLPYNRGADPNLWSFLDGTPAGVTIHRVDPGLDTGDIVAQRRVKFHPYDYKNLTLSSTYNTLQNEIQKLFKEIWPQLKANEIIMTSQDNDKATFHLAKNKEDIVKNVILPNGGWDITITKLLSEYKKYKNK